MDCMVFAKFYTSALLLAMSLNDFVRELFAQEGIL